MSGFGWGEAAQAATQVAGQLISNSANRKGQNRQFKYQQQLMDIQNKHQRGLNEQGRQIQLQMWNDTNVGAQMEHMKEAGLNIGMMYGGSGAGGTTTGSQGGGSAAGGSAQGAPQMSMDLGAAMMQAQQAKLMAAQEDKLKAEAENLRGGVRGNLEEDERSKSFTNDINELYRSQIERAKSWEWDMKVIEGEEKNAAWEFKKAIEYATEEGEHNFDNLNSRKAKARIAEMESYTEDLESAKINNDIGRAEQIMKEFEAELTKSGISPNSPWYAKLVTDILEKVGLLDIIKGGQNAVKGQVKGK